MPSALEAALHQLGQLPRPQAPQARPSVRATQKVAAAATRAQPSPGSRGPSEGQGAAAQQPAGSLDLRWRAFQQGAAAVLLSGALAVAGPVAAADTVKVGACLLQNCRGALARCLGDVQCVQSIACLQICNGRPDEAACQIRCGDLYNTKATDEFTTCAVTSGKCVDQRLDDGAYAPPPDCALNDKFDISTFTGKWYITAGLNPLFDTFPCQDHYLSMPQPGRLDVRMNWRVETGASDFIHRSFTQHFAQVEGRPAVLHNGPNNFLNYEDDWYVVASKPDAYHFVYYRGDNDAWKYYGGAVVYTREATLLPEYIPELAAAAERVGLKWAEFQLTDNTCKPAPPSALQQAENVTADLGRQVEKALGTVIGRPVQAAVTTPSVQ